MTRAIRNCIAALVVVACASGLLGQPGTGPVAPDSAVQEASANEGAAAQFTPDEIAVYRSFLNSFPDRHGSRISLVNRTMPLVVNESDRRNCLLGIAFQELDGLQSRTRPLTPEVVVSNRFRLADPMPRPQRGESLVEYWRVQKPKIGSGQLQLSEIVFDNAHRYAVLTFSFLCGSLCGQGRPVVYENVNGEWKEASRPNAPPCAGWIS